MQTYEPEYWNVKKDVAWNAIRAMHMGLDNTRELLADFIRIYGSENKHNKSYINDLETEIKLIEKSIIDLQSSAPNWGEHRL